MSSRSIFRSHRATLATLVLLSVLGVSVALADDDSDPPGRVARLSYADGSVSLQPAGVDDWADATVNRPLTTGDKLWTDQNSRAELDIGSAAIRLGSTTGFSFLNLDDQVAQMNVTAGTAIVHVRDLRENQSLEVDTPNVAVLLQSPGDYRVDVNDAGNGTVVKISNGDAQVSAGGQTVDMHTQQAFAFNGADEVTADAASVGAPDALDSWSIERDHRSEQAQAQTNKYVSPDVAGADDLAQYGTWESTPEYGDVWTPTTVVAGWSPYQDGRWVWVAPWGWTWVDDAPWGFAPFHYGRWAYRGTRWCWVPGPRHVRPVYAPALVAWVGSPGANVAISVGGGAGVGWFPLGPREVYVPGYHVSRNYVRNVNISNTTIVNNTYITNVYENRVANITYANRNRPGAVVAVSQDVFTSARPISGHTIRIPENQLTRYGAHGVGPAIAPIRDSVLGRRPDINVRRPPAAFVNRPVVARTAPPPAPVSFDRQQAAIRANGNRPLGRAQVTALQPQAAFNPRVRVVAPGPVRPAQNGQQFGPARPGAGQQFGTARPGGAGGQQMGTPRPGQPGGGGGVDRPGQPGRQGGDRGDRPGAAGGQQFGTARPGQPAPGGGIPGAAARPDIENRGESSLQDRERALHATPISPTAPSPQARPEPNNRPAPSGNGALGAPAQNLRNDRPPANQMRNDQYRMQNNDESRRQAQQVRPTPQATPIAPPPQARPIEQPRAMEQRQFPQARPIDQPRAIEQRQFPQARPIEQPRAVEQQPRALEQSRPQFRAPEPPRPIQRPIEQPRPEARAIEQPRAVPQPQARPAAPPPQARPTAPQSRDERRVNPPGRDPRVNRQ